jgi:hypothetical protein
MNIKKSTIVTAALIMVFLAGSVIGRRTAARTPAEAQSPETSAPEPGRAPQRPPAILAGVPDVRQSTDYSCGAVALQAVLAYWGISEREDRLIARLHSTPQQGTHPDDIDRKSVV